MRKLSCLWLAMCFLMGCDVWQIEELDNDDVSVIENSIEFEIVKSEICQEITPSNKSSDYTPLKVNGQDNVFVDVIMKTVNITDQEFPVYQIYSGSFLIGEQSYAFSSIAESTNYNLLTTTDTMKPNESRYIHLYSEISKDQISQEGTIQFQVLNEKEYAYTFTLEEHTHKNNQKSIGDILNLDQIQITINHLSFNQRIEPTRKGIFYKYIPTDHENEIFVILQIDVKNISQKDIDLNEYLYCEYDIHNQKIPAKIIIEDNDHKGLSERTEILLGQTNTVYLAMPIDQSLEKEKGSIYLFVEGKTYEIVKE